MAVEPTEDVPAKIKAPQAERVEVLQTLMDRQRDHKKNEGPG